ncbi:MAG: 8-oxoguanine deaminase [Gammaproteobacteria bacterium]|nr:8-oxoguanine deaminase [Gammaproteobacteria bacterium]MYD76418.1 8-oxoguanine deaminase [Gammaproteobacteria bacterium]MYJ52585.1 8-oxoguanine deaminase [Gammaproteobacteria bacterium]
MRLWIKAPLASFDGYEPLEGNGFVIENNRIVQILEPGQRPARPVDDVHDASDKVVIPGLINTHHHYFQTLTRACPAGLNKTLFPWLTGLYPIWAGLTPEMVHVSTRLACAELLLSGCTTSADHHYLYTNRCPDALDIQVEAVRQAGIRSMLTRGSMDMGKNQGGLPPANTVQDTDTILSHCEQKIDQYHDPGPDSMLRIALAPCSPFSVTRELMVRTAELAEKKGVRLHTHLAETRDENVFSESNLGCRPLDYLESTGWMQDNAWLAHGIHFDDPEIERLGSKKVGIAHCPTSNMVLGSGCCRAMSLVEAGARVGLGVDGSASNDCSNMMQEVRQSLLLQRLASGPERFGHLEALRLATSGSADCLGWPEIGRLQVGSLADIALYRLDELRFSGTGDPIAGLVLCGGHRACDVMVNGIWQVREGRLLAPDMERIRKQHRSLAMQIQQEAG